MRAGPVQRLGTTGAGRFRWQRRVRGRRRSRVRHAARLHRRQHPADVPIHLAGRARGLWRSHRTPLVVVKFQNSDVARWRAACRRVRARVVASRHPRVQHPAIGFVQLADSAPSAPRGRSWRHSLPSIDAGRRSSSSPAFDPRRFVRPSTARLFRSSPLERRPRASRAIGSRPPG